MYTGDRRADTNVRPELPQFVEAKLMYSVSFVSFPLQNAERDAWTSTSSVTFRSHRRGTS